MVAAVALAAAAGRWGRGGGVPPIVPAVIESKRRGAGRHCVPGPSEEGAYWGDG